MESMGPIRPNVITRWTKFQAQEHPEQYDMDDGIVVVPKKKAKTNLRRDDQYELYSDSIVIKKDEKKVEKEKVVKKEVSKPYFPRVKVELFMESMCPDTHRFIKGPLSKVAHDRSIMDIVDLNMYIFGKGRQISTEPQQFQCQHGPMECHGNMVENCFIKYTNPGDAIDALVCLHDLMQFDENAIIACSKRLEDPKGIRENVLSCIKGEGQYLLQKAYDKTPTLSYVPSMRINKGQVKPASSNLKEVICQEWKGEKPQSCP